MEDRIRVRIGRSSTVAIAIVMGIPVLFDGREYVAEHIRENRDSTITADLHLAARRSPAEPNPVPGI